MTVSAFSREKKIMVGSGYMEVDIFSRDPEQDRVARSGHRNKRQRETAPAQKNLNSKNARRYLEQLANGNFEDGDLFLTLTYKPEFAPKTIAQAERYVTNYLRRVARRRKQDHMEPLKYILVTEARTDEDGNVVGGVHHHLMINAMNRDLVERMWTANRKKLGMANTRHMDKDMDKRGNHFAGLADYMAKDPQGKKRWSSSRNLKRPVSRANDHKYRRRKVAQLAQDPAAAYAFYAEQYPDWEVVGPVEYTMNPVTGEWACYLKMWRRLVHLGNTQRG